MRRILAHERLTAEEGSPGSWLYILHGVFGAGRNWTTVARRLVRERPDWGVLLVDLRGHGASQGMPPPHTVDAAAEDLFALAELLGDAPDAVLGHSFGGKVALAYAARGPVGLRQVWVIDSTPASRLPGGSAWRMLELVRNLPPTFHARDELVGALEREGFARPVAQWMATNLERRDGGLAWRFDPEVMEELLLDFFRTDLWSVVERPPKGLALHFVKATESSVLTPEDIARIERAGNAVAYDEVAGSHWLNAENPDALVGLLSAGLPQG